MKLNSWFFREEGNSILSTFKSILCLYLLLFHSTPSDFNLYGTGGAHTPVGFFHILPQLTSQGFLQVLSFVFQASLLLGTIGVLTGPSLLVAAVSGAYVLANHYNYGTVGHGTTLIYTCLLVLALVPWSAWKRDYNGIHARWPIAFLKCFIVASYFIAGLQKLRFSGFEWAWSENLAIYMFQISSTLAGQILLELPPVVLRSLALFALLVELLSPLALLSRRSGYVFVFLWASLHFGIQLTMGHHKGFLSQIPCLLVFCEGLLLFAGKHARLQWGRLVKVR
ncbi:hypothetical protein [Bdellovibrio sp. HCB337]|uniref:hypothetical protein n=1 Tax=Bdellovibrio sp. HCB337 TaxID=3394358 RepID=UPI0039A5053D